MFYLVAFQYSPNTALTNRIEAYIKALSELKVATTVVFFLPDKTHSRLTQQIPNVDFCYMWDKWLIELPRFDKLSLFLYVRKFVKGLTKGDKVLVYGFPDLVIPLSRRQDISVFAEMTEHPSACFMSFLRGTTIPLYLKACSRIKGVIVISSALREYFIESGCSPECVHIINMIVDGTRFDDVIKQPSEPYIAYCGTASNTKDGVDQLILAFSIVLNRHPKYKLYIIGRTPSRKQKFENLKLVKNLGIEDSVVFTGIIPASDMPQVLTNAKILALDRPNNLQAKYGFPTKLGEYLLTSNPVVVTNVGDIPIFLQDGVNALIAEPDNSQNFAEKLCWAIEHESEARFIGLTGKMVAETKFNYLTETKKLIRTINH